MRNTPLCSEKLSNRVKKKFTYLLALAFAVVACDSVRVDEPVQYGEISVALAGNQEVVVTKAETVIDPESAEAAEYTIRIFDSDDNRKHEARYNEFKSAKLEFGTYYLTAENCSETEAEEGSGKMRVYGRSSDVTLSAQNLSQTVGVTCHVANAKVAVKLDPSVQDRFENFKVVFYRASGSTVTVRDTTGEVDTWFNPSTVNYTVSGTYSHDGIEEDFEHRSSCELKAKDYVMIVVNVDSQSGQLQPTVGFVDTLTESDQTSGFNPYK